MADSRPGVKTACLLLNRWNPRKSLPSALELTSRPLRSRVETPIRCAAADSSSAQALERKYFLFTPPSARHGLASMEEKELQMLLKDVRETTAAKLPQATNGSLQV